MSILEWVVYLLVAAICGSIGAAIVGIRHLGCLTLIAVGLIGAMLGTWLSRQVGMGEMFAINIGGKSLPILWTIIGSMLLTGIASLFWRSRRTYVV
jgi:uncharacterized membrane protein YeaQ/YmgE (transglycosylase-associated protein family)